VKKKSFSTEDPHVLVLGISGGLDPVYRPGFLKPNQAHDAAAALVADGEVVSAIEEERLNRVKHTNAVPIDAVRFCLADAGCSLRDVDRLAVSGEESLLDEVCRRHAAFDPAHGAPNVRTLIHRVLAEELGEDVPDARLTFVHHHLCHATSAFRPSGFPSSLVVTIDGIGDRLSGMVLSGRSQRLTTLRELAADASLGDFYSAVTRYLGFGDFDEYKVMGLAPYGDPASARDLFRRMYSLQSHGAYQLYWERLADLASALGPARGSDEPIEQRHMDVAAALQEALDEIVFHLVRYYRETTGHRYLCLAGGVAQNCSLNGKLLASGLFRDMFVQPASYDAGCALGAAWHGSSTLGGRSTAGSRMRHVLFGSDLGGSDAIEPQLARWRGLVEYQRVDDASRAGAELLASGRIIGWAQSRSEFGPRALGNRSILADPRPAENKDLVNAMIKKREAFRPFAPAAIEEEARDYFDIPADASVCAFMTFVVGVRPEQRARLGAVTHADGTARLQTVARETNPRFWKLIAEFKALTGVPVVLNTSFNTNAEPIVDSVDDAVICFLTSGLHRLIVGDFVVSKVDGWQRCVPAMIPAVPAHVALEQRIDHASRAQLRSRCWLVTPVRRREVSPIVFDLLVHGGDRSIAERIDARHLSATVGAAAASELATLWSERLVTLQPAPAGVLAAPALSVAAR
jgi:carbamoyltransferase